MVNVANRANVHMRLRPVKLLLGHMLLALFKSEGQPSQQQEWPIVIHI
jgi:hypothetical protein